jgi:prepilin-type processing-associated H-X9-DG protein
MDPRHDYKFVFRVPIDDALCESSGQWNFSDPRGFAWASGEFRCGLYNHHSPPNSPRHDCVAVLLGGSPSQRYTPYGWRAARSLHSGGVNVAMADGSIRFVAEGVDPAAWQAMSTIQGGETE